MDLSLRLLPLGIHVHLPFILLVLPTSMNLYVLHIPLSMRQFLIVSQISFEEPLKGASGQLSLKIDIGIFPGVVYSQSISIFLQMLYLFLEVRVAVDINLIKLILIDKILSNIFQVLICSPIILGRISK